MYTIKYWNNKTNAYWLVKGFKTFNDAKKEAENCIKESEPDFGYEIIKERK